MTFTVTPQPDNVPPRVRIDIDTDDPAKPFMSLSIMRDGKPLREQPYVGSSRTVVFDYEAPFGVPVTYTAAGMSSDYATVMSEFWTNLAAWSTSIGSPGVTGGRFYSPSGADAEVVRVGPLLAAGRLTVGPAMFANSSVTLATAGGVPLVVAVPSTGVPRFSYGGPFVSFDYGSGEAVVTFDSGSATVTTANGSWTAPRVASSATSPMLRVRAYSSGGRVPSLTLAQLGAGATPFTATATTTLDVADVWLIHPSQPALSCQIDPGPGGDRSLRFIEASSGEARASQAQSTIHRPVGRRRAVVITSGPRAADEWTLVVGAPTIAQKNAVRTIVDDQSPLLLRSPVDFVSDLPDDWYAVGDVTVQRLEVPVITEETLITLPLTPVDEPIVRQGALWTYGADLLPNPIYSDSRTMFPTYLDRLMGEQ